MHSVFSPASPEARAIAHLWWWMLGAGGAIWIIVTILALRAARSPHVPSSETPGASSTDLDARLARVVSAGVFVTVLVLAAFLVYDFSVGRALAARPPRALTIDVTGHQWWWEVTYDDSNPSRRLTTANEIHVPVGQPVQFELHAADVIHSFWAPNLNGKRDLIPGYGGTLRFQADTPGVYRGQCAEFCGLQHAKMAFYIVAQPPAAFAAWRAAASQPSPAPAQPAAITGQKVFMTTACAVCHTIAGTDARATLGPDLSHVASRRTIAAGALVNTPTNLLRWIADPAAIKPGVRMPAVPLSPADRQALVAYLETLK